MPRHHSLPSLVHAVAVLSLLAATARAEDPDHVDLEHRLVRIGATSLHPETLTFDAGDGFGWINYSDEIATVSFPAAIGQKLFCKQKTSFHLSGDHLVSGDIQARQFVTLCSLAPGEYPYRVMLRAGIGGSGPGAGRTLEGRLVVR